MKKMFVSMKQLSIAIAACGMLSAAHAGLIGNNVEFSVTYPGPNGPTYGSQSGVIADGTVLGPIYSGYSIATFTDHAISFTATPDYIAAVFYNIIGNGLNITGVTATGIDASRVSFDSDHIFINVGSYPANFSVDVQSGNEVPEPASIALLAVGAAGLGFARRRKAKAT